MQSYDKLVEKWAPVLNENSAGSIDNHHKRAVTAAVLENQEIAMREDRAAQNGFLTEAAPGNATSSIGTWDPVLISLVRRSMPNLMAYDVAGVQPMSGPTGLIFAMKARYVSHNLLMVLALTILLVPQTVLTMSVQLLFLAIQWILTLLKLLVLQTILRLLKWVSPLKKQL